VHLEQIAGEVVLSGGIYKALDYILNCNVVMASPWWDQPCGRISEKKEDMPTQKRYQSTQDIFLIAPAF